MNEDVIGTVLVGDRRAHQYLRHWDIAEHDEAVAMLTALTTPGELVAMAASLTSIARTVAARLPVEDRIAHARRAESLEAMFEQRRGSLDGLHDWVGASADEALRMIGILWPRQDDRLRYYSGAARRSFEGEEPGSTVRQRYFGEAP